MKKAHTVVLAILLTAITCSCSHRGGDGAAVSRSSGFESAGHSGSSAALREDYGPASFSYSDSAPRSWDDVLVPDLPPVRAVESSCADYSVDGEYARLLPLLSNETPVQEIMSETYPSVIMGIMMNLDREYTVTAYHIQEAKSTFPVSFLRQTEQGGFYTVNKVTGGGYAYIFFDRPVGADLQYLTDDRTDLYATGCIYAEKTLCSNAFQSIQTGDTIDDVIAIDNAASITKQWSRWYQSVQGAHQQDYISKHLLTDGIMMFRYSFDGENLAVIEKRLFSDFNYVSPLYQGTALEGCRKNFSILPQDYPPES